VARFFSVETGPWYRAYYLDEHGREFLLEGKSILALQQQLPNNYYGPKVSVRDRAGFVRGFIWHGGWADYPFNPGDF
jgi:hypothetical protein